MAVLSRMLFLTAAGICLFVMLPSGIICAQELESRNSHGVTDAAAAYCDGKALGRIDNQIYLSATKWLHCMTVGQRCEYLAVAADVDMRLSVIGCVNGLRSRDYETERKEFWRQLDEIQAECVSAIGGPCGFSSQLLNDDEIAKIPSGNLSTPRSTFLNVY